MEKIITAKETKSKTPIKTWSRRSTITPDFVGLTFTVHNGKVFNPVFVTENMVGHHLGEFSPTRTFKGHTTKTEKAAAVAAAGPPAGAGAGGGAGAGAGGGAAKG